MTTYTRVIRARKDQPCDEYPPCRCGIKAGETYARHVAFPDGEVNLSKHPWVIRECAKHYEERTGQPLSA